MKLEYRECQTCHKQLDMKVPNKKFCSVRCRDHAKHLRRQAAREEPRECKECKKTFTTTDSRQIFCSDKCQDEYTKKARKAERALHPKYEECIVCGKKFIKLGSDKCCSRECSKEHTRRWQQKYHKEHYAENVVKPRITHYQETHDFSGERPLKSEKKRMRFAQSLHIERLSEHRARCLDCGTEFTVSYGNKGCSVAVLRDREAAGTRPCPKCGEAPVGGAPRFSQVEIELCRLYPGLLNNAHPAFMNGKELDLFNPDKKIAIEYHGIRWHSGAISDSSSLHKEKADLCERAGVQLIQIYETEWKQRKDCVIDKLDAIFHKDMARIPARKLQVKILETDADHEKANRFLDENHIQGHSGFQWGVALMDGGSMMAVCTFKFGTGYAAGGQAKNTSRYWELNRFATKLHTCVQGGLSRCISAFWKTHPEVTEIFSFADRRWTCPTRSAYSSSGFEEVDRQRQNYMYTSLNPNEPLRNKQFMRKSNIARNFPGVYSDSKTELEMATELGFYRIYDAGKIKYRMKRPQ